MYLSSAHNEYLRVLFRLVGFVGSNIEPHSTQMSRENMVEFYLVLISNNTVKYFHIALDFRVGFVSFDICCHNFSFPINFSELPGI